MHVVYHEDSHRSSIGTWGSLQLKSGAWRSAMFSRSSGFSVIESRRNIDWRESMLTLNRVSFWHDVYYAWTSIGIEETLSVAGIPFPWHSSERDRERTVTKSGRCATWHNMTLELLFRPQLRETLNKWVLLCRCNFMMKGKIETLKTRFDFPHHIFISHGCD